MFERFTDRARRVVVLAQEEARLLDHNYIGTEHILLGLVHEGEGVAARVLAGFDVDLDGVRQLVREIVGVASEGDEPVVGHIPFTPRAKTLLELSLREALQLGHNYIGTEHILLGLIREGEGVAAQILFSRLGLDVSAVRVKVIQVMSGYAAGPGPAAPRSVEEPKCPWCSTALEGRLGTRALSATRDEGGVDPLLVVYCRACGRFLNVLASSEPQPPGE